MPLQIYLKIQHKVIGSPRTISEALEIIVIQVLHK